MTEEAFESGKEFHELLQPGPFGLVWLMSGKHRTKWTHNFIDIEALDKFAKYLGNFHDYLYALHSSVCHYFRRAPYKETASPPPPLPLLGMLEKLEVNLQTLHEKPALDLDRLELPAREEEK
jgi:hypothetical protein